MELVGACLRWSLWPPWSNGEKYHKRRAPPDVLARFVRLADDRSDKEIGKYILGFARKYGPMNLCVDHELPVGHEGGDCGGDFREPVASWRALARAADALRRVQQFQSPDRKSTEIWERASWLSRKLRHWSGRWATAKASEGRQRELIAHCVNDWLACSSIRPRIDVDGGFLWSADSLRQPNLFGVLALALAFDFSHGTVRSLCCRCKRRCEVPPNASPARRVYCESCRKSNAPVYDAQRKLRRQIREAKRLAREENLSPIAIVKRLRVQAWWGDKLSPEQRVRRWLS
jgi:hypothetical protein